MAAYASLLSLSQTLSQIVVYGKYQFLFKEKELVSHQTNVSSLLTFLEDESHNFSGAVNILESRIIDAAYQAEDIIESKFSSLHFSAPNYFIRFCHSFYCSSQTNILDEVFQELDTILEEVMKIKNNGGQSHISSHVLSSSSTIGITVSDTDTMIGFSDDFMSIKHRIYQQSSDFQVIPIVGMGGIGKSTLAHMLYEDAIKSQYFDRYIWIVVSQDYTFRKVLTGIMRSIKRKTDETCADSELQRIVYQELFGRRYLIVVDDLWNEKAWDDLNMILPKNAQGSRVLLTTRLLDVASYVGSSSSPPHKIQLMNEEESWTLLKERVFGKGSCPFWLEQIGKRNARKCRGLPLMIVVVAGLLKRNITQEYWETLSRNISSAEPEIAQQCTKVLYLSYDHLPMHLKPCFLHVTAFPEDYEIKVERLIKLWMAEGFVKASGSKCLEDVAEGYLCDLVGRSLLQISKKRYDNRIKSVKIHDMLRDIGTIKAREGRYKQRRLSIYTQPKIHTRPYHVNYSRYYTPYNVHNIADIQDPMTRTLIIVPHSESTNQVPLENSHGDSTNGNPLQNFRLLRVLDSLTSTIEINPNELFCLRYLAIKSWAIPKSLFRLQNLQTLFISGPRVPFVHHVHELPLKIWKMPSLRHLTTKSPCFLKQPSMRNVRETNMQTLSLVTSLKFSTHTIKLLANLRKLDLYYPVEVGYDGYNDYQLNKLIQLEKLEELKIVFRNVGWRADSELAFPPSLKKLTVYNFGLQISMNLVEYLPNVEVLKLRGKICMGGQWNRPVEDQFLKLRYLELRSVNVCEWDVDSMHFPRLEVLVLKFIGEYMKEIPSGIGDIDTLKLIELHRCHPSIVASAKQIQVDQQDMGNEEFQVRVFKR